VGGSSAKRGEKLKDVSTKLEQTYVTPIYRQSSKGTDASHNTALASVSARIAGICFLRG